MFHLNICALNKFGIRHLLQKRRKFIYTMQILLKEIQLQTYLNESNVQKIDNVLGLSVALQVIKIMTLCN